MRILEPHMSVSVAVCLHLTGHTKQDRRQQSVEPAAIVQIYREFIYCYISVLLRSDVMLLNSDSTLLHHLKFQLLSSSKRRRVVW